MNDDYLSREFEYCPRCDANLTLQKGYDPSLPYWVCLGCGELLINPELDAGSGILWRCDRCEAVLNAQQGFNEECGEWICTECGHANRIDPGELFLSEDEYRAEMNNPYRGLSNEELMELSSYEFEESVGGRGDIILVRHRENGERFIEKFLTTYDKSIYEYLKDHPIAHMPRVTALYESDVCLVVLESYIEGRTLEEILGDGPLPETQSVNIAKAVCRILCELQGQEVPIIHRDIKPSNIILAPDSEVYLLDMNVAKWYAPDRIDDTVYMGTQYYAAPEQVGYGFSASSDKTDIYAVGMLLNVMLTGTFPKERKAEGKIWSVIERCISLDAKDRYSAKELLEELEKI